MVSLDAEDCDKRSAKRGLGVSGLALSREGCRNWSASAGLVLPAPTLPSLHSGIGAKLAHIWHDFGYFMSQNGILLSP